jgi:preprotein translocase subunit SecA
MMNGLAYPERLTPPPGKLDKLAEAAAAPVSRWLQGRLFQQGRWLRLVAEEGRGCAGLSDAGLIECAADLRPRLIRDGFRSGLVAKSFALVREAAYRTIGQRHFDVQLLGGRVLLEGRVAEMETGEGKTLTATLPACTAALGGLPVHVVTVNDYLAARDSDAMGPVYRALGLTVGVVVHGMTSSDRQAAYACDIVYCTNKELVFDYLKDRIQIGQAPSRLHICLDRLHRPRPTDDLLLRGLHYAIVDEADSVLIDEARTPLIIASIAEDDIEQEMYQQALRMAKLLSEACHYTVDRRERVVRLTPAGESRAAELAAGLGGLWRGRKRREALIEQALVAFHLFHRDQQYLVHDSKIQIIDEYTGRVMADRRWERGLHQMIETKEQCPPADRQDTLARISYQRFFRRYLRLSGMTGTAREVAGELWSVYRLGVVRIPTNRPGKRQERPDQIYATAEQKWRAVMESVVDVQQQGRPVIVGTRTVEASEHLSRLLTCAGLSHRVLNARQDREEAAIIAHAAEPGCITVATNMAGRGTDIRLTSEVAERGGLHVIATERHDAHRVDRQLFGRCGRQGDQGTCEAIVSLEDQLITDHAGRFWPWFVRKACCRGHRVTRWTGRLLFRMAQKRAERLHASIRRSVLKSDEQLDSTLAFAGRSE